MEIEIYKKGINNPYIIANWGMFFELFGNPNGYSTSKFANTFEFWNPFEKRTLDNEMVFGHLLHLWRIKEELENMLTKEL